MKNKTAAGKNKDKNVFQLKIILKGSDPVIWRRVLAPADYHLGHLHTIIQMAMGWTNSHLHQFEINGENYTNLDDETELSEDHHDEKKSKLGKILAEGERFLYTYDFGDGWRHEVVVEKILPLEEEALAPACVAGANACPPEDCGGIPGYYELLETKGKFDPAEFDLDDINAALKDFAADPEAEWGIEL